MSNIKDGVSFQNLHPCLFLERSARVYTEKPAVIYGTKIYTYKDLQHRVDLLAGAFVRKGITPGDRIAYMLPNIPELLEGHYGPMRIGAVLVAINTRLSAREVSYILRHSGARAIVFDSEYSKLVEEAIGTDSNIHTKIEVTDVFASIKSDALEYETFLETGKDVDLPPIDRSELDTVAIDYTSGTTGEPKGVEYSGRGTYLNALGQVIDAGLRPESKYLWTLPMFHCNGWCYTWAVTAAGGAHICLRKVDAEDVFSLVAEQGVTHMCAAPSVLSILENSPMAVPEAMQGVNIFTGGAPPSPRILRAMDLMGADLHHLYGLTETYGPSTIAAVQPDWKTLSLEKNAIKKSRQGVPTTTLHTGVRVVADDMTDVPENGEVVGEVVIRGNTVMKGYFTDPESTEEAFRNGWFHTGDMAVVHPDGYIELKDRKKDVIISGGENISSVEVELVLMEHHAILEACVIGIPDDLWGEVPKAFLSLRRGKLATEQQLIDFCRERLAHFKVPKAIVFGSLPKTATGKIQKFALRDQEWAGYDRKIAGGNRKQTKYKNSS